MIRDHKQGEVCVWLGDSHARFNLGHPHAEGRFCRVSDSDYVWSIGPRLMYSVAREGWPRDVIMLSRLLNVISRTRHVRLCFVLGEIDVRVFLGERVAEETLDLDFVPAYVTRCKWAAQRANAEPFLVVPVPPFGPPDPHHEFPRRGCLDDRLSAHQALRQRLLRESTTTEGCPRIFDATPELATTSAEGGLNPAFTTDGFHLNSAGARAFLEAWHAALGASGAGELV